MRLELLPNELYPVIAGQESDCATALKIEFELHLLALRKDKKYGHDPPPPRWQSCKHLELWKYPKYASRLHEVTGLESLEMYVPQLMGLLPTVLGRLQRLRRIKLAKVNGHELGQLTADDNALLKRLRRVSGATTLLVDVIELAVGEQEVRGYRTVLKSLMQNADGVAIEFLRVTEQADLDWLAENLGAHFVRNLFHLRVNEPGIAPSGISALPAGMSSLRFLDLRLCPGLASLPEGMASLLQMVIYDMDHLEIPSYLEHVFLFGNYRSDGPIATKRERRKKKKGDF